MIIIYIYRIRGRGIMAAISTEQRLDLPTWVVNNYPELPALREKVEAGRSLETSKLSSGRQVTLHEKNPTHRGKQEA